MIENNGLVIDLVGTWYKVFIAKEKKYNRYAALVMTPSQLSNDPRRRRRRKRSLEFLHVKLGTGKQCAKVDQLICNGPLAPSTNYRYAFSLINELKKTVTSYRTNLLNII